MGNIFSRPNYIQLDTQFIEETGLDSFAQLACASRGASIESVSDEFYGKAENLLKAEWDESENGWQVRRHLDMASVTIRLGCIGTLAGLDINTLGFTDGASSQVSIQGLASIQGEEKWVTLLDRVSIEPDAHNFFQLFSEHTYSSVRLTSTPGGGISRLRCYGVVSASLKEPGRCYNLASANLGAQIVHWTDHHSKNKPNILLDHGKTEHEGWLTPRSRNGHRNDFVVIQLAATGVVHSVVLDTTGFAGNHPKYVKVEGCESDQLDPQEDAATEWFDILHPTACFSDGQLAYEISQDRPVSHIKLSLFPDGGLQQIQILGSPQTEETVSEAQRLDNVIRQDLTQPPKLTSDIPTATKRSSTKKPARVTKRVRSK